MATDRHADACLAKSHVHPQQRGSTTPQEANSWCDGNGFASDQCFAKLISTILGVSGTTVYRH
jgi:hypothetical protein